MKKIFIITLIGSMFFMLTVLTAGEDEKKDGKDRGADSVHAMFSRARGATGP